MSAPPERSPAEQQIPDPKGIRPSAKTTYEVVEAKKKKLLKKIVRAVPARVEKKKKKNKGETRTEGGFAFLKRSKEDW